MYTEVQKSHCIRQENLPFIQYCVLNTECPLSEVTLYCVFNMERPLSEVPLYIIMMM